MTILKMSLQIWYNWFGIVSNENDKTQWMTFFIREAYREQETVGYANAFEIHELVSGGISGSEITWTLRCAKWNIVYVFLSVASIQQRENNKEKITLALKSLLSAEDFSGRLFLKLR